MTDRIDEIKARAGAATPGGELFARLTQECDDCYTPRAQLLRACTYHEGWLDGHGERDPDIDYLLAEVERLRAALEVTLPYAMAHLEEWGFFMEYNGAVSEVNLLNEIADLIGASHFGGES